MGFGCFKHEILNYDVNKKGTKQKGLKMQNSDSKSKLIHKIDENYASFKERWLRMQPAELIERCEELEAVTRMADELPSAVTEEDAEYLLRFRNPLEVVSDEWISRNGMHSLIVDDEMSHMLWSLRDRRNAELDYELEPEFGGNPNSGMDKPAEDVGESPEAQFFKEVGRKLRMNGLEAEKVSDGVLTVTYTGRNLCVISNRGEIRYRDSDIVTEGQYSALEKAIDVSRTVRDYLSQIESAPVLEAEGLDGSFKLLAEMNQNVLAGKMTKYGPQFVTWERTFDGAGLCMGHYFDDYSHAKQDFAIRSGLVNGERLFSDGQMVEIYRCCQETLDSRYAIMPERESVIKQTLNQIELSVDDLQRRVEQSNQEEIDYAEQAWESPSMV